ncbi:MAG TPA: YheU family protein [Candidatus Acidoferrum sp.]|nr:YheU family protein [Candidatus Acidoferrum sp.]
MEIPHTALEPDTLRNLVEEFVTREGTDYGPNVYSLDDKVRHVLRQLDRGTVVIVYDGGTQTCHIETRERLNRMPQDTQ